jgi:hypothetical protein
MKTFELAKTTLRRRVWTSPLQRCVFGTSAGLGLAGLSALATLACGPATPPSDGGGSGGAVSGSGGTTGTPGSGGSQPVGTGGAGHGVSTGGSPGAGGNVNPGTGGAPPGGGDLDDFTIVPCTITTSLSAVSPEMGTVGTIEFSTDLAGATGGFIQFGKTTDYTLEAPIDWAAANHRTLLLGMTSQAEWHYRIVVTAGQNACTGPDTTLMTEALPNGGPPTQVTPTPGTSTAASAEGFIVAGGGIGGLGSWAFILNTEGEVVWAHEFQMAGGGGGFGGAGITRAKLSWDGKTFLARDVNVDGNTGAGNLFKVNLDGTGEETIALDTSHHDFTVIPGGIAYLAKAGSADGCDAVHTANEDGTDDQVVIDLGPVLEPFPLPDGGGLPSTGGCHANAIHYYADEQAYTVSDRERDMLVKVSAAGDVLWTIGNSPATITGADIPEWRVQHGHHLYDPEHLLVFSNGELTGGTSHVLHFTISGTTATPDWNYSGMGSTGTLGDVQKLPNGNVLITTSQIGTIQEIDENNVLIKEMKFTSLGYTHYRPTLYGEPAPR